jgi:hypothetical protein
LCITQVSAIEELIKLHEGHQPIKVTQFQHNRFRLGASYLQAKVDASEYILNMAVRLSDLAEEIDRVRNAGIVLDAEHYNMLVDLSARLHALNYDNRQALLSMAEDMAEPSREVVQWLENLEPSTRAIFIHLEPSLIAQLEA